MKKTFLLFTFLCISFSAKSQVIISLVFGDMLNSENVEFGLDGGWTLTNIDNLNESKSNSTWNLGFYFDFKLKKNPSWMINTGVLVKSTMGAEDIPVYHLDNPDLDNSFTEGSVTRQLSYFNVPIMMKYQFKNHIYIKAGTQLGLRYRAKDVFTSSVDDGDLSYTIDVLKQTHPLDAGLAIGTGYRLMGGSGMNIGMQYYYGLVDIMIDDNTPNQYNRALYINVGIPIGKGKAAEKAKKETELKQEPH